MNKKFSTLVAALIVSGGSFAMVSQYAGSALAESPLAVAAAANLRATYSPAEVYAVPYTGEVENWQWTYERSETDGQFYLKNAGGSYLSYTTGGDGKLYIAANGEKNYTKAKFKLNGNNVQLVEGEADLMVVGGTLKTVGEGNKVALYKDARTIVNDDFNPSISYYLGEIVEEVATLSEATTITNAVEKGDPTLSIAMSATTSTNIGAITGTPSKVKVSDGVLEIVVPDGATPLYLAVDGEAALKVVAEKPTNDNSLVGWNADGKVRLGVFYLKLDGENLVLSTADPGDAAVYFVSGGAALTAAERVVAHGATLPVEACYLLSVPAAKKEALRTGDFTAKAAVYTAEAAVATFAAYNAPLETIRASQQWQVVPTGGGFYITDGIFFLTGNATAGQATTTVQTPTEYSVWKLVDGAIAQKTGGYFLDNAVKVQSATENKMYLYAPETAESDYRKSLPAVNAEAGTYLITTRKMKPANLDSERVKVKIITSQDSPEPEGVGDWEFDDEKAFATGDKVTISNADKSRYLNVTEDGKLESVTGTNAQIWTVTVNNSGAGKTISFENQYGQKLAFAATYDKTARAWKVDYSTSGKYSQFDVNAYGEIVFMVSEDASAANNNTPLERMYELNINANPVAAKLEEAEALQNTFVKAVEKDVASASAAKELLNETYGAGNGFGILFKDMAITEDDVEDVTLESNPFSDAAMITAVTGPDDLTDLRAGGSHTSLNNKLFLKVSGNYPLTDEAMTGLTEKQQRAAQVDAFRASEFIAVDTVRYSSLINDIDNKSQFYKYVKVKGSEMLSYKGYYFDNASVEDDFKSTGNLAGVTRRIENAEFTVSQIQGGTASDPIQLTVNAIIPAVGNNQAHLLGHKVDGVNVKVAIKQFNNKYYLGAAADENAAWPYIYVGMNNDVDYKTINGIVTLISRNYKTDGQVYATNEAKNGIVKVLPKYVCTDKPEGQYVVTGGNYNRGAIVPFIFTNRESGIPYKAAGVSLKKTDKANIYAVVGSTDTLEIKAAATGDEFVGYKNYSANELANTSYVLKVVSNAAGIQDIYIAEDHNKDHSLGLNADTLESATFKLIKFEDAKSTAKAFGDTVRVSEKPYSYVYTKNGVASYKADKKDNVVAFTYAIYNADNMEFLAVTDKGSTLENFFYCDPDKKYNVENAASAYGAQRFILKEKADGAIQLIPVNANDKYADKKWTNIFTAADEQAVQFLTHANTKLYAGLSDNKLHTEGTIYKIADNDLFRLVQVGAPMYRKLDGEVYDKVRIYKEGMQNIALFAQSADATILSGKNFLGMEHKADADLNKTMFSFMVDTAYVDRADNYKPEYLLAIDAEIVPEATYCPEHGLNPDCSHATKKIGYATGSYLVSLADSAAAWTASKAHNNPYLYDNYARLGFVKATHIGDALAIERGKAAKADTLDLKAGMTKASFALRIVDQDSKSFVMETKGGYIKWLNGVPVVVPTVAQAEVLNIEATENAATANEAIAAEGVQVIGGHGAVTVQGAAGKVITVANVLGQTIANQVAASDNVTIAAPAGVIVVAVEGEATKVVVK